MMTFRAFGQGHRNSERDGAQSRFQNYYFSFLKALCNVINFKGSKVHQTNGEPSPPRLLKGWWDEREASNDVRRMQNKSRDYRNYLVINESSERWRLKKARSSKTKTGSKGLLMHRCIFSRRVEGRSTHILDIGYVLGCFSIFALVFDRRSLMFGISMRLQSIIIARQPRKKKDSSSIRHRLSVMIY
ncbi:hypothetical protein TNCT_609491 [Trichonephila clavata]|uniref:Uncharacterized protein n=1 Tax=Trichonephila clavata TaxID=2740835 RepID=A0A8X6HYI1_TRICU|nr:hypothetical protein TNCT_609491 [Trichonephila clavata]